MLFKDTTACSVDRLPVDHTGSSEFAVEFEWMFTSVKKHTGGEMEHSKSTQNLLSDTRSRKGTKVGQRLMWRISETD